MNKELLVELINYVEQFESTVSNANEMGIEGFITFVSTLLFDRQVLPERNMGTEEVTIARNLSLLHRYSRGYIKKALSVSQYLQTEEEYTYLVCLLAEGKLTKTELHSLNGMERTSGSEVLRRLLRRGLIEEMPDERDKRSVCVMITPLGRKELMSVFPQLKLAASLLSAPLAPQQLKSLSYLLDYLCGTHAQIAKQKEDTNLEDLLLNLQAEKGKTNGETRSVLG